MVCDSPDPVFQILNDNELIKRVRDESVGKDDDLNDAVKADTGPSASEAFTGLVLKWVERRTECDYIQLLTGQRMSDMAA